MWGCTDYFTSLWLCYLLSRKVEASSCVFSCSIINLFLVIYCLTCLFTCLLFTGDTMQMASYISLLISQHLLFLSAVGQQGFLTRIINAVHLRSFGTKVPSMSSLGSTEREFEFCCLF